jgi:hypothetical protein
MTPCLRRLTAIVVAVPSGVLLVSGTIGCTAAPPAAVQPTDAATSVRRLARRPA